MSRILNLFYKGSAVNKILSRFDFSCYCIVSVVIGLVYFINTGMHVEAASTMHYATELCSHRYGSNHPVMARALLNEADVLRMCALSASLRAMPTSGTLMHYTVS